MNREKQHPSVLEQTSDHGPPFGAPSARRGRSPMIVIAGLIAVALGIFLFSRWRAEPVPRENEGRPIADLFLTQIREGKVDEAWKSTTSDFKSDEGRDAFRAFVAARPGLSEPMEFLKFEEFPIHGLIRWKYTYRLKTALPSGSFEIAVVIANENGTWKVEQLIAP